jgi:hypothetical protein
MFRLKNGDKTKFESFAFIITNKTNASFAPDIALWEIANARETVRLTSGEYIRVHLLVRRDKEGCDVKVRF